MSGYVISILGIVICGIIIDVIIPVGSISKYIKGIYSVFVVAVIISPVINLIANKNNVKLNYENFDFDQELVLYIYEKRTNNLEMEIEDADKCSKIFENLGFKEVRTVVKDREYYKYENYEISLDNVHGLDPYMEIEISLDDDSDYTKAQESIFELFEKLGITDGFERTSYLELLEELDN